MKLIREEIESVEFLVEQKNGKKSMYIEEFSFRATSKTVMVVCTLWRHFAARSLVITKTMFRQVEHLANLVTPMVLPLISIDIHKIVSLKENGSNFIGKAKILNTPMGKIASSLIEEGVKLGVSSRGIGSLKFP